MGCILTLLSEQMYVLHMCIIILHRQVNMLNEHRVVGGTNHLLSELGVLPSNSTTAAITSFVNTVALWLTL